MNVYYKNHLGEIISLKKRPYHMLTGDLLDYKWEVLSSGSRITGFGKGIYEKTVEFETFTTKAEYHQALDRVTEVFEKDILACTPGRLYINGQYLRCFITESKKSNWESDILAVTELVIVTDYPYWITEKEFEYRPSGSVSKNNKQYPYKYHYRYSNGLSDLALLNDHYGDTDFRMIVFGPVSNPAVFVNEHLYQVNVTLEAGEYLTIDSAGGTITVTQNTGQTVNVFNNRLKESDIFQKIGQGNNRIRWNGEFGFNMILLQERSQPKCA